MDLATRAREGSLGDKDVVAYLGSLDLPDVMALLQAPAVVPTIHTSPPREGAWTPTDGRPGLADEDPAVICAMARCAVARWRASKTYGDFARSVSHDQRCGWCDYPADELDRAIRWSEHFSRLIISEAYVWRRGGSSYRRDSGRAGVHENPNWATFAAMPAKEQRYLVDRAVEASRANLVTDAPPVVVNYEGMTVPEAIAAARDHLPWCDLRPDHAGECPAPPED